MSLNSTRKKQVLIWAKKILDMEHVRFLGKSILA